MIFDMVFVSGGLRVKMNPNVAALRFQGVPVSGSTCNACGEPFESPLLAMVFNDSVVEEYYACPNCLSKVASIRHKPEVEAVEEAETVDDVDDVADGVESVEAEIADEIVEPGASVGEVEGGGEVGCLHELGYLKRRPKNTPIPEECLTCSKMIDCMY